MTTRARYTPHLLATACLLLAFGSSQPNGAATSPPTVTVDSGALQGVRFGSTPNEVAFLGVPYAAPPVGDLRWKPPVDVSKWNGTRQAAEFGASCPQLPAGWLPELAWNEDCLYLNVWTTHRSSSARQPVIVWLHGGGNKAGRSQHNPIGPALSRKGVVVVSVNYRLGPFGFLAHPALSAESSYHASGNYALLDQLQALKWVRRNIARFGGDPDQITLMGHSAGAYDACLLMSSPMAAGMFQRAIIQSGDCQGTPNQHMRTGEAAGERFAQALGVTSDADPIRTLRAIPAHKILETSKENPQLSIGAVVDGWLIPEQPSAVFAKGQQLRIPVIVGSTSDEATIFVGHRGPTTIAEYWKYLSAEIGEHADQAFEAFPAATDADVPARFLQLQHDLFGYGAYSFARSVTRAGQRAYLYYFTYAGAGTRASLGAYHGEELLFLSDVFPEDWEQSGDEARLGETMRTYWTQFAKTGNPNAPSTPTWSAYDLRVDHRFELGRAIGARAVTRQLHALERLLKK